MRFSSQVREAGSLEKPEEPLANLRVKGAKFFLQRTVVQAGHAWLSMKYIQLMDTHKRE